MYQTQFLKGWVYKKQTNWLKKKTYKIINGWSVILVTVNQLQWLVSWQTSNPMIILQIDSNITYILKHFSSFIFFFRPNIKLQQKSLVAQGWTTVCEKHWGWGILIFQNVNGSAQCFCHVLITHRKLNSTKNKTKNNITMFCIFMKGIKGGRAKLW